MLVLTRKLNQEIILTDGLGNRIRLIIVEFPEAKKVRIGIEADRSIKILRGEICDER